MSLQWGPRRTLPSILAGSLVCCRHVYSNLEPLIVCGSPTEFQNNIKIKIFLWNQWATPRQLRHHVFTGRKNDQADAAENVYLYLRWLMVDGRCWRQHTCENIASNSAVTPSLSQCACMCLDRLLDFQNFIFLSLFARRSYSKLLKLEPVTEFAILKNIIFFYNQRLNKFTINVKQKVSIDDDRFWVGDQFSQVTKLSLFSRASKHQNLIASRDFSWTLFYQCCLQWKKLYNIF